MGKYTSTHRHTTYTYTTTGVHTHMCRHTHITVNFCSSSVLDLLYGTARLLQKAIFLKGHHQGQYVVGKNGKKFNNNNNFSSVILLMTVSLALCSNHYNLSDLRENQVFTDLPPLIRVPSSSNTTIAWRSC